MLGVNGQFLQVHSVAMTVLIFTCPPGVHLPVDHKSGNRYSRLQLCCSFYDLNEINVIKYCSLMRRCSIMVCLNDRITFYLGCCPRDLPEQKSLEPLIGHKIRNLLLSIVLDHNWKFLFWVPILSLFLI